MGLKKTLKKLVDYTPLYGRFQNREEKKRQKQELEQWEREGRPVPPPHVIKQKNLLDAATKYNVKVLVETGTYLGEMIEAMAPHFDRIYSIELSDLLHAKAKRRFKNRDNIYLIHGDSGKELKNLLAVLKQPAVFWLDGHYSAGITAKGEKDTPIYEELEHIFNAKDLGHVIIIDDARCFGPDPGYPSLDDVKKFIKIHRAHANIEERFDSIIITPCEESD